MSLRVGAVGGPFTGEGASMSNAEVLGRLRDRVVGELHLGRVRSGDRLPGVREIADELEVGVRAVVRAYKELEKEGLVEIRSRSGVYVAPQEELQGEVLQETARWMSGVLGEAVKRRITIRELPELIQQCTKTVRPRCILIESTEDHLEVLRTELETEFGFAVTPFRLQRSGGGERQFIFPNRLPRAVGTADFLVTTTYHATLARELAEKLAKPLVVITVHPSIANTLERQVRSGALTVVCADPGFGMRVKAIFGGKHEERIRVIAVDQTATLQEIPDDEPVMVTLAASKRLGGVSLRSLLPHSPSISPDSARELADLLVRINIAAQQDQSKVEQ